MLPRHRAHFLLPLFSLPPLLSSNYGSVEMQWVTFQKKSPYQWRVGMYVWATQPISTAQWTRQDSKGVKCKSKCKCLAERHLQVHHCRQQREMWSSLSFHGPLAVALTRTVAPIHATPAVTVYEINPSVLTLISRKPLPVSISKTEKVLI